MNNSDIVDILLRIHKAVDANFKCYRRSHPEYNLPLRLEEKTTGKYNNEERYRVQVRRKDVTVWLIQPIVMAVGLARQYNIEDGDIMAFWGIEQQEELDYKYLCFNALNNLAAKSIAYGVEAAKEKYESGSEEGKGYRWWLKYQLCSNHIKLHQPKKRQFFDDRLLKY